MTPIQTADFSQVLTIVLILMGISTALGLLLMGWVLWRIKRIELPPNADFQTALRKTPFLVVLVLDLLDLGLDFFSAPISWVLLGKLGLSPLRKVTMVESIIPGTQALPTMTIAWLLMRLRRRKELPFGIAD